MIGIPLGLLAANASEWLIHKHWLHGRGKKKGSFWSFHWHEHHNASRKRDFEDPAYHNRVFTKWDAQTKEVAALAGGVAVLLPFAPVAPFFIGTLVYSAVNYYRVHKRSHLDPEWAKEHLPWHYDHHMGPNQDANWCVTKPWFDQILGTREPWLGTEAEQLDRARREARAMAARDAARATPVPAPAAAPVSVAA